MIDVSIRDLPTAKVGQRILANVIDAMLLPLLWISVVLPFSIVGLLLGVISNALGLPWLVTQSLAGIFIIPGILLALWVGFWGTCYRVSNTAQTLGMSVAGIAVASDVSRFKSPFLTRFFGWLHISQDGVTRWRGDEEEERGDTQIWRGLFLGFVALLFAKVTGLVVAISHIPFIAGSVLGDGLDFAAKNEILDKLIVITALIYFCLIVLGTLLAFYDNGRTFADHFLGVRMVSVSGSGTLLKPSEYKNPVEWVVGRREAI